MMEIHQSQQLLNSDGFYFEITAKVTVITMTSRSLVFILLILLVHSLLITKVRNYIAHIYGDLIVKEPQALGGVSHVSI